MNIIVDFCCFLENNRCVLQCARVLHKNKIFVRKTACNSQANRYTVIEVSIR